MGWSRWPLETPSWATPDTLCQSCLHDPRFVHVTTLPAPFTRPGHPALCLEDPLALKVTPQPDSWCGSEGPAPPGWNETPEQSSPFLPSTTTDQAPTLPSPGDIMGTLQAWSLSHGGDGL